MTDIKGLKMPTRTICIKLPDALRQASEQAAAVAGLSVGVWMRQLAEQATGVKAEPKQGFAALSDEQRGQLGRAAARKRWKK